MLHDVSIAHYMQMLFVCIEGIKRSLISGVDEIDAFKGEGVSHLYGKHKANYHTKMQCSLRAFAKQWALQIIAGMPNI